MSDGFRDVGWYYRKVVDRDGRPRRYTGGPLRKFSAELDAFFYGIPRRNQVARDQAGVSACCRLLETFAGWEHAEVPFIPEPLQEDTTEWIRHLHTIWDIETIAFTGGATTAVDFKLDVLRALANLPKAQVAAFVHYMDGYTLDEIRRLAAREPTRPWSMETAERAVRRASSAVRARCGLDIPGKRRQPLTGVKPTTAIRDVELLIVGIRERRRQTPDASAP